MSDWVNDLDAYRTDVLRQLSDCPTAKDANARFCTLATIGQHGAEARMVVCRAFDDTKVEAHFFTDSTTAKVKELTADPRATLLFWFSADALQVRLRGRVTCHQGDRSIWDALPDTSQAGYGPTPLPGAAIDHPGARTVTPDFERFMACTFHVGAVEALHLDRPHHQRAVFTRESDWSGTWIAP